MWYIISRYLRQPVCVLRSAAGTRLRYSSAVCYRCANAVLLVRATVGVEGPSAMASFVQCRRQGGELRRAQSQNRRDSGGE